MKLETPALGISSQCLEGQTELPEMVTNMSLQMAEGPQLCGETTTCPVVPQVGQLDLQQGLHKATHGIGKGLDKAKSLKKKATGNGAPETLTDTCTGGEAAKQEGRRKGTWKGQGNQCLST